MRFRWPAYGPKPLLSDPRVGRVSLFCAVLLLGAALPQLYAGGSGLNVVVVVNEASTNSLRLGNYYCEKRGVPPQNVLRMNWTGGPAQWAPADFTNHLLQRLLDMLQARQLSNQVDYVVLSMDIPYRVSDTNLANGTTSALFYGLYTNGPDAPWIMSPTSTNYYAGTEGIFRDTPPSSIYSPSFLTTMLTASNVAQAEFVVDQGVASDGTFPTAPAYLGKSSDRLRNVRYLEFDDALFDVRLHGGYSLLQTNTDILAPLGRMLGYQNGTQFYTASPGQFVPGAMADTMTSFGGVLYEPNDQNTLLGFLNAGASGSYGTVTEPANYLEKFPSARDYFYQARGFSLAECYYLGITNPYQGLLVGEPLAAPFAKPASGSWLGLPAEPVLSGSTNLTVQFFAADAVCPVQRVDLFVDGTFLQTLTNIPPQARNVLTVTLNKTAAISYTVQPNTSIAEVAVGLASALNAHTASTRVQAFVHGDRLDLHSVDWSTPGSALSLQTLTSKGTAPVLTTWLSQTGDSLVDSIARGRRSYTITNAPVLGDFLECFVTKTNGESISIAVTNSTPGMTLAQFARELFTAVSNSPALQAPDGVVVEDVNMHEDYPYNIYVYGTNDHSGEFNVRTRGPGWGYAQTQVQIRGSSAELSPPGLNHVDENLSDLQARAHLYVTAGVSNLPVSFALNTTALPDGYHELTAVVYEGSHVRTQKRIAQRCRIQNTALSATLSLVSGASNNLVGSTLRFWVAGNSANISKIQLLSTGGTWGGATGVSSAEFTIATANLGVGLHPFYALVTASTGAQYRTDTRWVRVLAPDMPNAGLRLTVSGWPPTLSWPATYGRTYEIQSTPSLTVPFVNRGSLTATNSSAVWTEPSPAPTAQFYRVQALN